LVLHQQESTWGKLLLRDIPASQVPQELLKLDAAAQHIEARQGRGLYGSVQQVPQDAVVAAARAAQAAMAAAGPGSSLFKTTTQEHWQLWQRNQQQQEVQQVDAAPVAAVSAAAAPAAAAKTAGSEAAAAAADADGLAPKQAARHMFDSKQLEWFGQQESSRTTGEMGDTEYGDGPL
jgi:DNA-directed RNA polymerase specialized sigma24 family protein